eukprot:TRINITY_DN13027_c0_g1_i1.p1 TRINITY_DN13027_c0_g1~~TRINITY_DN13027_c0_g1_i1.p1  ORF type:complete len:408 (+),score=63.81 TRINITY_DN13027_c0_g1_i1:29-1252(+)
MSARNGGRAGWNSSSLKRDLSGSIQVRSSSAGARGKRRVPVAGKALAAAGVRSASGAMDQPVENQPYPDRLEKPPTARSRSASVQRQQHISPQPQPSASHTPATHTHSFYTSAPTDAPPAPASQRHLFQYNAPNAGGYRGHGSAQKPAIGSRKRSSSSCSLPPPTPPTIPSTPVRGASPMRRNSTSGTVGGSIVPQHQSSQRPHYDKYNYSTLRDTSPARSVRGASPHKSIRNPSPSRRQQSTVPPQESLYVEPVAAPAPTSDAWERLVLLAKDDFSPEELAMLYWDTLSRLLTMYGINEPMEVARIEITWKEIQAVRSAIDNPTPSHHQQQIIVAPPPGPGRGSRDPNTKQSYTPFTYTFKRDTPIVARNTISGTPIVTPQQELEARRQSATGTMRSSSPAQRPWM